MFYVHGLILSFLSHNLWSFFGVFYVKAGMLDKTAMLDREAGGTVEIKSLIYAVLNGVIIIWLNRNMLENILKHFAYFIYKMIDIY